MLVFAVPGRLVRDPATRRVVDDAGILIDPHDPHWTRLLADGDVAETRFDAAPVADVSLSLPRDRLVEVATLEGAPFETDANKPAILAAILARRDANKPEA